MPHYFVSRYRVSSSSPSPPGNDDSIPSSVEEIFMNYIGRRVGFFRAFFRDANRFYASCDPEKGNMCLYAHPNGSWEVIYPTTELPPKLPEPALGINFARDGIPRNDWLAFVALLSDSWLLSLVSFFSARLSRHDRNCLFDMINDLPTLHEEVTKYHPNEACMRPRTESRDELS